MTFQNLRPGSLVWLLVGLLLSGCGGGGSGGVPPTPLVPPPPEDPEIRGSDSPYSYDKFGAFPPPAKYDLVHATLAYEPIQHTDSSTHGHDFVEDTARTHSANFNFDNNIEFIADPSDPDKFDITLNILRPGENAATFPADTIVVNNEGMVVRGNNLAHDLAYVFGPVRGRYIGAELNYSTLGVWRTATFDPAHRAETFFVTGVRTLAEDLPTRGTATYYGITSGTVALADRRISSLQGYVTVDVNFTNHRMVANFSEMLCQCAKTPEGVFPGPWHDFTATMEIAHGEGRTDISRSIFGGMTITAKDPAVTLTGQIGGGFFGPRALELGGSYVIESSTGDTAVGAFIATRP